MVNFVRAKAFIIRITCAVATLVGLALAPQTVLADDIAIAFSPDNLHVELGQSFSIDVIITSSTAIRGAQTGFSFNPDVLRCDSITNKGKMFTDWVTASGGSVEDSVLFYPAGTINNATGTISNLGVAVVGPELPGGPTGSGIFCTLNFTALSTDGVSSLFMTDPILSDAAGQALPSFGVGTGRVIAGQPDGPDLFIESLVVSWQDQDLGLYMVDFTIKNIGTQPTEDTVAYVNIINPDPSDSTGEKVIITKTEVACAALNPEETQSHTVGPITIEGDQDVVELVLDATELVAEVDEYNNSQRITWDRYGLPDLSFQGIAVTWQIQNQAIP